MMLVSAVTVGLVIAKPLLMILNGTRDNNGLEPFVTKFPSRWIQDSRLLVMGGCGVIASCNTANRLLPDRRLYRCTGNYHCIGHRTVTLVFYRAMHFSAKRGIAIACRPSVRPSVCLSECNVQVP